MASKARTQPSPRKRGLGADTLLTQAIQVLNINVPIYRFTTRGNTITLWLYGHTKPVKYTSRSKKATKASALPSPRPGG